MLRDKSQNDNVLEATNHLKKKNEILTNQLKNVVKPMAKTKK